MKRLTLLISAVGLGATVAFTNNDVSVCRRQSSARRRVLYSDCLSGPDSFPEEPTSGLDSPITRVAFRIKLNSMSFEVTPTGKATEYRSKPSSDVDCPSTEKSPTSAAPTDYMSNLSSGTTTSSTSGSWAANDYASSLSSQHHKETRSASHSGAGIPSYVNALSSTATSYPSSPTGGPGVTSYTETLAGASSFSSLPLVPTPPRSEPPSSDFSSSTPASADSSTDLEEATLANDLSSPFQEGGQPKAPPTPVAETTDLQSQFGQILGGQLEITKQVGISISELKEMQDQQGQYMQIMAKNDIEMTQTMVSVRDDSSEMKSYMRQSQSQQASLEHRLAALEAIIVEQAMQLAASPEPTSSTPTPAATAIPQTSILDTSSSVSKPTSICSTSTSAACRRIDPQ
jgi:hypothetical protein